MAQWRLLNFDDAFGGVSTNSRLKFNRSFLLTLPNLSCSAASSQYAPTSILPLITLPSSLCKVDHKMQLLALWSSCTLPLIPFLHNSIRRHRLVGGNNDRLPAPRRYHGPSMSPCLGQVRTTSTAPATGQKESRGCSCNPSWSTRTNPSLPDCT